MSVVTFSGRCRAVFAANAMICLASFYPLSVRAADTASQVRVLCYNIHYGQGTDGQYDIARLAEVIRGTKPDLVALQEVDAGVKRSGRVHEAQRLADLTGMAVRFGPTQHYEGGLFGNAVLSRLPILDVAIHPLPSTESTAARTTYPRGAIAVIVKGPQGTPLRIISTHFQHNVPEDRLAEAQAINQLFADDENDIPTILAGDMNAVPDSEPIAELLKHWSSTADEPATPTAPSTNPRSRIDYVFYRPASKFRLIESQVIPEAVASDHRPVFAILKLEHEVPQQVINRPDSSIRIDGRLDEPAWRNATEFGDFSFPWWTSGKREQTAARMLWDDEFLYVSFQCDDAYVSAEQTGHDSRVYLDDCVELFTAPNPLRPGDYFNIEMNVNGTILDRHHPDGPGAPEVPNWNTQGVQIATTVNGTLNDDSDTDRGWILEVAIPFANFAQVTGRAHPQDGDIWHLNLNRLGGRTNPQHSQWSPGRTEKPAFHHPEFFGGVTFSTHSSTQQALHSLMTAGYRPSLDFLEIPDGLTLGPCSAVDTDRDGNLYLCHRGPQPVLCFTASGRFVRSWGDGVIGKPHGLRVDPEGNVWVTDLAHHMVFKFCRDGELQLALGTQDRPGDGPGQFNQPTDIAFAPNGDVYVTDGYGNNRVVRFDRQGKRLSEWGTAGTGPGEFDLPHSIVIDAEQRILVGDRENDRIQVFDLNGRLLDIWNGFAPYGIDIDTEHRFFIADARASQVLQLDRNGVATRRLGGKGHAPGQFELPHMLCVDTSGSILVAEVGGIRFQKLEMCSVITPSKD
ncbi:6-bladed beta-propeller [bacterium]|nr:6-bladed beta-propeller [bacterium]